MARPNGRQVSLVCASLSSVTGDRLGHLTRISTAGEKEEQSLTRRREDAKGEMSLFSASSREEFCTPSPPSRSPVHSGISVGVSDRRWRCTHVSLTCVRHKSRQPESHDRRSPLFTPLGWNITAQGRDAGAHPGKNRLGATSPEGAVHRPARGPARCGTPSGFVLKRPVGSLRTRPWAVMSHPVGVKSGGPTSRPARGSWPPIPIRR